MASDLDTQQARLATAPLGPAERTPGTGNELILLPQRGEEIPPAPESLDDAVAEGTDELDRILRANRRYRLAVMRRTRRRRTTPGGPTKSTP